MSDDDRIWRSVGGHQIRIEEPRLVSIRFRGDVAVAEVTQIVDTILTLAAERGPLFMLIDVSGLGDAPMEARKIVAQRNVLDAPAAIAYVGGTFGQRILARLTVTAAKLGARKQHVPPVRFFATEAEGRAWLASAGGSGPPLHG